MQKMESRKITSGTKEWADNNINIVFGCENNCRYCYAKKMAIRFERKTEETWKVMEPNFKAINNPNFSIGAKTYFALLGAAIKRITYSIVKSTITANCSHHKNVFTLGEIFGVVERANENKETRIKIWTASAKPRPTNVSGFVISRQISRWECIVGTSNC